MRSILCHKGYSHLFSVLTYDFLSPVSSALCSAQYAVYNSIFSTGAAMVLKKTKVLLPIEIHVTFVRLQTTHKPTFLLYFSSLLHPFLATMSFAGYLLSVSSVCFLLLCFVIRHCSRFDLVWFHLSCGHD